MRNKFFAAFVFLSAPYLVQAQNDSLSNLLGLSLEELMHLKGVRAWGYMSKATDAPSIIRVIKEKQIKEGYEQRIKEEEINEIFERFYRTKRFIYALREAWPGIVFQCRGIKIMG